MFFVSNKRIKIVFDTIEVSVRTNIIMEIKINKLKTVGAGEINTNGMYFAARSEIFYCELENGLLSH